MRQRLLPWIACAGLAFAPVWAHGQKVGEGQALVFTAGVELVSVSATVRDQRGRLVSGLTAEDFHVMDRGERRAIRAFRAEDAPLSVAILFDVSGSMSTAQRTSATKLAAHYLLGWLEPGRDEAALFAFDSRLHEVAPFTVDTRTLQGALGEVDPFGATSLHDAVAEAARRVASRATPRRAVIVLTDGVDTASRLTPSDVSGIASVLDVPIYVIATVLSIDNPDSDRSADRLSVASADGTLEDLARWTGGTLHYSSTPAHTAHVTREVVAELRQLYLIAFEPGAEGWHPIEIRTRDADHTVRARAGYVAGEES